jgi:hypothetical protein
MNQEHCKAILSHIQLITHYANGGDVGHRAPNCKGDMMPIHPSRSINLNGLRPDGATFYLMLKPKYRLNKNTKRMERVERTFNEFISDSEIIQC